MQDDTLKLLIVEDENAIAILIQNLIDFDGLGLQFCGIAHDGLQGLAMMRDLHPDIIITDISMPNLSGIDMITRAREEGLKGQFIISSGLQQFRYAMSAINMGVAGYVLKPINREELNSLLEDVIMRISRNRRLNLQLRKARATSDRELLEKRRSYLMNLLYSQRNAAAGTIEEVNRTYGFHFQPDCLYAAGCVHVDGLSTINYSQQQLLLDQLIRKFSGRLKESLPEAETYARGGGFVFVCSFEKDRLNYLEGQLSNLQLLLDETLQSYVGLSMTISLGYTEDRIEQLEHSLESATRVLNARVVLGNEEILKAAQVLKHNDSVRFVLPDKNLSTLMSAIDLSDKAAAKKELTEIFRQAAIFSKKKPAAVYEIFEGLYTELLSALHQNKHINGTLSNLYLEYREQLAVCTTLTSIILFSSDYVMKLLPLEESPEQQETRLAQNAKKYINDHLKEELKLEDVANQFYLSASYFGVVFKEKTGETFTSYVATARMNRAKQLLSDTALSVDEIAAECGYQDRRYFSKLFKKTVGIAPKDYRKLY